MKKMTIREELSRKTWLNKSRAQIQLFKITANNKKNEDVKRTWLSCQWKYKNNLSQTTTGRVIL